MRHSRFIAAMFVLGLLASARADDGKSTPKDDEKTTKEEIKHREEVLAKAITITAKIARVENGQRLLSVDLPYQIRTGVRFKRIDMQATDNIKIRILNPPADFDAKGKPRRYTSKELKEMKGPDTKRPGYTADFDSLKPGQIVNLYLPRPKPAKPSPPPKKKSKDDDDLVVPPEKPEVLMVVILQEPVK
jgi:hypothetical protein